MSNVIPVTTKYTGMRNPNPMPSSRVRMTAPVRRVEREPHDEPRGERTEHELESCAAARNTARGEEEDRGADTDLARRVQRLLQDAQHARRSRTQRDPWRRPTTTAPKTASRTTSSTAP